MQGKTHEWPMLYGSRDVETAVVYDSEARRSILSILGEWTRQAPEILRIWPLTIVLCTIIYVVGAVAYQEMGWQSVVWFLAPMCCLFSCLAWLGRHHNRRIVKRNNWAALVAAFRAKPELFDKANTLLRHRAAHERLSRAIRDFARDNSQASVGITDQLLEKSAIAYETLEQDWRKLAAQQQALIDSFTPPNRREPSDKPATSTA